MMNIEINQPAQLTQAQGELLVRLARHTLEKRLRCPENQQTIQDLEEALNEKIFQECCGTFVTLKIGDNLRGCIGSLEGYVPLPLGVRENAVNAAFRDPRFTPLTQDELEKIRIEVSVLTPSKPLSYSDDQDLLEKLRPHVDGVIIRKDAASATFLPQVWEQLPNPKNFLRNLCLKAGLSADEWRSGKLNVFTYQVQYFEEK